MSQQLKIGSGLSNLGNTCFFNAVMQSVLHTKKLSNYFLHKNHSKNCQKQNWCVFCQMQKTYNSTRNCKVYSPNGMISNLKTIFKKFKLGRQQDSHQFLRYLIQGMQQCQTGKLEKDRQKNQLRIKKTKIFNIFGGIIKNVVQCQNCKHKSITTQRYYDLNIECQKSNTVQEGLQRFFATDQLKGANKYLCQNCKNRVDATKRFYLESVPNTFTFQLKRFNNFLRKIGKFIKYPKFINFGKYFDDQRKTIVRLSAVIVHAGGSADSGHYYAFVRIGQNWFKMDDSWVSKCTQQQAMSQIAYILLYEKIKQEIPGKQKQTQKNKTKQQSKIQVQNITEKQQQKLQTLKINQQQKLQKSNFQDLILTGKKIQIHKPLRTLYEMKQDKQQLGTAQSIQNIEHHLKELKKKQQKQKQLQTRQKQLQQSKQQTKRYYPQQQEQQEEDQYLNIPLPTLGPRKKSKQQAQQNMSMQQILFKYAVKISQLHGKLPPPNKIGYRNLRPVYNLRKYQIIMKRRKLQN